MTANSDCIPPCAWFCGLTQNTLSSKTFTGKNHNLTNGSDCIDVLSERATDSAAAKRVRHRRMYYMYEITAISVTLRS